MGYNDDNGMRDCCVEDDSDENLLWT